MIMAVHGITLVFPSTGYNSKANLEAIQKERYAHSPFTYAHLDIYCSILHFLLLTFLLMTRCNWVYGTPTMFTDMLNQDLHKYDLSSVEGGKTDDRWSRINLANRRATIYGALFHMLFFFSF